MKIPKLTVEQFNALSKEEKKMIIAQDVLNNIKVQKYIAARDNYIKDITFRSDVAPEADIKKNFSKIESCHVCVLGSCLLSATKYKNQLTFSDIGIGLNRGITQYNDSWDLLMDIFDREEIEIMELCFEGDDGITTLTNTRFNKRTSSEIMYVALEYKGIYEGSRETLEAIMKNIIRNSGNFIPQQDIDTCNHS